MNIPEHIYERLQTFFFVKIFKFFNADPDPGSGIFLTLDQGSGMEKFGSGITSQIRYTSIIMEVP
jgi:hypothetical protein